MRALDRMFPSTMQIVTGCPAPKSKMRNKSNNKNKKTREKGKTNRSECILSKL